eukprot:6584695-Prymnesium_polylepis.1
MLVEHQRSSRRGRWRRRPRVGSAHGRRLRGRLHHRVCAKQSARHHHAALLRLRALRILRIPNTLRAVDAVVAAVVAVVVAVVVVAAVLSDEGGDTADVLVVDGG